MNTSLFLSELSEHLLFHGIPGKISGHMTALTDQKFFVNAHSPSDTGLLYPVAGGTIAYNSPINFESTPLPYVLLAYVRQGCLRITTEKKEYRLEAGSFALSRAKQAMMCSTEQSAINYQVYFLSGDALVSYLSQLLDEDETIFQLKLPADQNEYLLEMMRRLNSLLTSPDKIALFYQNKVLTDILTEFIFQSTPTTNSASQLPKHVQYMKEQFDLHYSENHSLKRFEDILGINHYRLCRDFSKHVGCSPIQYLNHVRMMQAVKLLQQENLTVRAIGELVGISNTNHFIHLFEKNIGTTPQKYRQNVRHYS